MNKTNNKKTNKVVAGALALGLLATGTFAWTDMKQHKTNTAMGSGVDHEVSLIDIFNPDEANDWKVGNDLNKEVRVLNKGDKDGGNVYVSVSLREYMEIGDAPKDIWSEERFMIDSEGRHIKSDSFETLKELIEKEGFEFREDDVKEVTVKHRDGKEETSYYHMTKDEDANGIYGKHIRLDREEVVDVLNAESLIEGVKRAEPVNHHDGPVQESEYPLIDFKKDNAIREYVKLPVSDDTVLLESFNEDEYPDGVWILDEGRAYWSQPLVPGESTANLVNGLTLINDPDGAFYYDLHVELEAVDAASINKLGDLPKEIEELWKVTPETPTAPEVLEKIFKEDPIPVKSDIEDVKYSPTRYMFYDPNTKLFFKNGYLGASRSDMDVISTVDLDNNLVSFVPTKQNSMFINTMRPRYKNGKIDVIAAFKSYRSELDSSGTRKDDVAFTLHNPETLAEYEGAHTEIEDGFVIPIDTAFFNDKGQLVVPTKKGVRLDTEEVKGGISHLRVNIYDIEVDDDLGTADVKLVKTIEEEPKYQNMNIAPYKDGYVMYHLGQLRRDNTLLPGEVIFLDSNFEETSRMDVDLSAYGRAPGEEDKGIYLGAHRIFQTVQHSYTHDDHLFIVFNNRIQKVNLKTGDLSEPVDSPGVYYLDVDKNGNSGFSGVKTIEVAPGHDMPSTLAFVTTPNLVTSQEVIHRMPKPLHQNYYAGAFAEGKFYVSHALGELTPVTYTK